MEMFETIGDISRVETTTPVEDRILKTYVKNKRSNVNKKKQSVQNYAACYLCEDEELPPNLAKHVGESENSKTCEQVHLDLLSLTSKSNGEICAAKQILYRDICCKVDGPAGYGPARGALMAVAGACVFWLIARKLKVGCRSDTISTSSSQESNSDYENMDEKDNDGDHQSARSRGSSKRSRKKDKTTKLRGRSRSNERSKKPPKTTHKKPLLNVSDEISVMGNSITAESTMAVFHNELPTQVV